MPTISADEFYALLALAVAVGWAGSLGIIGLLLALGVLGLQILAMAPVTMDSDSAPAFSALSVPHLSLALGTAGAAIALVGLAGVFARRAHQEKINEQNLLLNDALATMAQ